MAPNIDTIILKLLTAPNGPEVVLDCSEIKLLSTKSIQHFKQQPILLELDTPVNICGLKELITKHVFNGLGEILGQYQDLLRIFRNGNHPPHSNYLFLGDYVDRGNKSVEVLCLLLAYKIKYPEQFFLLRGNHEDKSLNVNYGFQKECLTRYKEQGKDVFDLLTAVYGWMPLAALTIDKQLYMNGGLSPHLNDLGQIRDLDKGRPLHVVPRIGNVEMDQDSIKFKSVAIIGFPPIHSRMRITQNNVSSNESQTVAKCGPCPDGVMEIFYYNFSLPGYDCQSLMLVYEISSGIMDRRHVSPGESFRGDKFYCLLPDSSMGHKALELLIEAWTRRFTFTIRRSTECGGLYISDWYIQHDTDWDECVEVREYRMKRMVLDMKLLGL